MPREPRTPREILEQYLAEMGLSQPADAAMQLQHTLLHEWTDHLAAVLAAEGIGPPLSTRIIRGVIWGGAAGYSELELRRDLTKELTRMHERMPPDPKLLTDMPPLGEGSGIPPSWRDQ